jgi:MoaA/NifB/PqqE/SkfB family radical SAM enzyme
MHRNPHQRIKVKVIDLLMATLAHLTENDQLFKITYRTLAKLAEELVQRDYYVRKIRWIRELFDQDHPSVRLAKRFLRYPNPHHRKTIIQSFILNEMLLGTNKRKAFAQTPGGFYPPGMIVISPTMRCNLNCSGCYAGSYAKNELSLETINRVLDEAKEMGTYFITVSGGEPFFREDIFEVFRRHKDVAFLVFTHGGLIDEKMAKRIIAVGNVAPAISIEGFREHTDRRRGTGHFDKVMGAMDMLREAGVIFGYSATQTRENSDVITSDAFVDMLRDKGCLLGFHFMYVPVGRDPDLNLMPTPAQRDQFRASLSRWRNTRDILFLDFWNDGPVIGGCMSGARKYCHINAQGDVEPCVFCHFATHNIHRCSLKEALNSPLFQAIREQQPFHDNLLRACMLVDKPEVGREMALTHGAYFTHQGAEAIFTRLASDIDHFADGYQPYADCAWEQHFLPARQTPTTGNAS